MHRAEETIRRWIWTGKLPARKLADGYRVQEADVAAVASHLPLPEASAANRPGLREWVADVTAWRAGNQVSPRGGAGQLVIEDRAERSDHGDR